MSVIIPVALQWLSEKSGRERCPGRQAVLIANPGTYRPSRLFEGLGSPWPGGPGSRFQDHWSLGMGARWKRQEAIGGLNGGRFALV